MSKRRALIIGGSIGGLFAANCLRKTGWDVSVFERVGDDLASRGAGIGTHDELRAVIQRLGLAVDDIGVWVHERVCLERNGRVSHRLPTSQLQSSWARVYRLLKDALPAENYRFGMSLEGVEQDSGGVTAMFANGTRLRGDLLVAADGVRSTVRGLLLPEAQPRYAGYVAWRGLVDEATFVSTAEKRMFGQYTMAFPDGEMILCYPVPGRDNDTQPGRRGYNHIWYRPTEFHEELRDICIETDVRLLACQMTVDLFSYRQDEFIPEIAEWIGATSYLAEAQDADVCLFV